VARSRYALITGYFPNPGLAWRSRRSIIFRSAALLAAEGPNARQVVEGNLSRRDRSRDHRVAVVCRLAFDAPNLTGAVINSIARFRRQGT
jgi:hypothetical protein